MVAKTFSALALTLSACHAYAGSLHPLGGRELLKLCQDNELTARSLCQGYILGASDAGSFCIPAEIRSETLANLVVASLGSSIDSDPRAADTNAAALVQLRIGAVFPCDGGQAAQIDPDQNWSNKKRIGK